MPKEKPSVEIIIDGHFMMSSLLFWNDVTLSSRFCYLKETMAQPEQKKATEKKLVLLQGGALVRHVLKKGGKGGQQLSVDDLNEEVLQARLKKLNEELKYYKPKCNKYKAENEWFQFYFIELLGIGTKLKLLRKILLSILPTFNPKRWRK